MSGESVPLALPLVRLATDTCEVTTLYHELRKPLLRYLVCLGLTADEAQDVVQDAFVSLHRYLVAGGSAGEYSELAVSCRPQCRAQLPEDLSSALQRAIGCRSRSVRDR